MSQTLFWTLHLHLYNNLSTTLVKVVLLSSVIVTAQGNCEVKTSQIAFPRPHSSAVSEPGCAPLQPGSGEEVVECAKSPHRGVASCVVRIAIASGSGWNQGQGGGWWYWKMKAWRGEAKGKPGARSQKPCRGWRPPQGPVTSDAQVFLREECFLWCWTVMHPLWRGVDEILIY